MILHIFCRTQIHLFLFNIVCFPMLIYAQIQSDSLNQYGSLKIDISDLKMTSFYLVIDDEYDKYKEMQITNEIKLPVGNRKIMIITEDCKDYIFFMEIKKHQSITKKISLKKIEDPYESLYSSSYNWIKTGINVIIYSDEDSDIYINGKLRGRGMVKANLSVGIQSVLTKNEYAGKMSRKINVNSKNLKTVILFTRPNKIHTQLLSLLPGASQFYKGETIKGSLFLSFFSIGIAAAIIHQVRFNEYNNEYELYRNFYRVSSTESASIENADKAQYYYSQAENHAQMRNIFLYPALGVYILSFIDGIFNKPACGYRQERKIDIFKDFKMSLDENCIRLNFTITF